jgi:hypothetical protein
MKPSNLKRRKFLGSLFAGGAGVFSLRTLIGKSIARTAPTATNDAPIVVEPHPSAVPRKRTSA